MISRWYSTGLFLLAFLIPTYLVRFNLVVPTTLFEVFVWLFFLATLLLAPKSILKIIVERNHWLTIGVLLIILGGVIGLRNTYDLRVSEGLLKGYLITPLVAGLLVLAGGKNGKKPIEWGLILAGVIVGLTALWQIMVHTTLNDGRAVGIFGLDKYASPNYLALFLASIAVLIIGKLFQKEKNNFLRSVYWLSALAIFGGIVSSQSRAGLAIAIAAIFWFTFLLWRAKSGQKKIANLTSLLVIIIGLVVTIIWGAPQLKATPKSGRVSSSNNIRYEIWKTTVQKIIPLHPLTGLGIGSFQPIFKLNTQNQVNYPEYIAPWALTPHNVFLTFWVDFGLLGLLGFIVVCLAALRKTPVTSLCFGVIVSILLFGFVDTTVIKNDLGAIFWIFIAGSQVWFLRSQGK